MADQHAPPARRLDDLVARQARMALIEGARDTHAQVGRHVVSLLDADDAGRACLVEFSGGT